MSYLLAPQRDLATRGGSPVRDSVLPYSRQCLDEEDIQAVVGVLRSDWLTTGPNVEAFEEGFAGFVGAGEAVAVSNGTAALHAAMYALGIGPGDEVIVPAMTFAASANCVVFQGARPVFADVDPNTLLLDPAQVEQKLTPRTKAIVAVDYAGQPCDYDALRTVANRDRVALVADASHALGASYKGASVGTLADLTTFSLHPAKPITAGEGGIVATDDPRWAERMRRFRNHGISSDHRQRDEAGSWFYEMVDLGYNYRLTDFQCALALSQLRKLPRFLRQRQAIARAYDDAFASTSGVIPLVLRPEVSHAYHLYVIQLELPLLRADRSQVFRALRAEGIAVNVHYIPVHTHPYYRTHFHTKPGDCPIAEQAYERIVSLPIFPSMSKQDTVDVISALWKVLHHYGPTSSLARTHA